MLLKNFQELIKQRDLCISRRMLMIYYNPFRMYYGDYEYYYFIDNELGGCTYTQPTIYYRYCL